MASSKKSNVCTTSYNFRFNMKKYFSYLFLLYIFACQPIEKNEQTVFDNNQLSKFDILSNSVEINANFELIISEPYIGHTLDTSPSQRIVNWVDDNFNSIGKENIFYVNILDASLIKKVIENDNAKKFDEKTIYKYEIYYLVEYSLYDDANNLISTTLVESKRSTTSGIYISIQEQEKVINDLLYLSLVDLATESRKLILKYMSDYIL